MHTQEFANNIIANTYIDKARRVPATRRPLLIAVTNNSYQLDLLFAYTYMYKRRLYIVIDKCN